MVLASSRTRSATPRPAAHDGGSPRDGARSAGRRLVDEHAILLHEVRSRTRAARRALGAGRWPAVEIRALVDYLHYEVLDQAVEAERLLFPLVGEGCGDSRIQPLVADHVRLRELTERLATEETAGTPAHRPDALAAALDDLEEFLERHMRQEQAALSSTTTAGVEGLRRPFRCHQWFPMTEGPVIDLDLLPREFAERAALEGLARLRPGEHVQVCATRSLDGLWNLVTHREPGAYGWAYLEEGPHRWRAEVTRRAAA